VCPANVSVRGQTMADWFVEEYMLGGSGAGSPHIVGYYISSDLRRHCNASGPVRTRAMHYGIRGCVQAGPTQNLSDIGPHVAAFLLLRGDYAFLSTGWSGCGSATHEHTYVQ
jgi:hypothetical protein